LKNKKALILDMNSTFMFGEDNFEQDEDFSIYYKKIGGQLSNSEINLIIRTIYDYLSELYPKEEYRENFPTLEESIEILFKNKFSTEEKTDIINTFAFHELGFIPQEYVEALFKLNKYFVLSVVIDIWAPKDMWIDTFKKHKINQLFKASSFSSDCKIVKPSPKPFMNVVEQLGVSKKECLIIGDSIRRDLGGAINAEIDCVLVGGNKDKNALANFDNLLKFTQRTIANKYEETNNLP
jgi:FMN phosphatase YigB (HAD superfamily)